MPVCAFCGRDEKTLTRDHVPPRGLFGDRPTGNLITVPSCSECNKSTSEDDENFRLLAVDAGLTDHKVAREVNESVMRAVFHPKKEGLKKSIFKALTPVLVPTASGNLVQPGMTLTVSTERLRRTMEKTIRGLFYKLNNRPLPAGYTVWVHAAYTINNEMPATTRDAINSMVLPRLQQEPIHKVGENVFRYRYCRGEDNPNLMFFTLSIYEVFDFLGFTVPGQDEEQKVHADLG